ncbi:non-hydrolyzing UDP-N-acetylglucosamine 2-epimerase [Candidatus Fonsibacter ubiquis]|uniref:non-hydrolyzing UDP-N-acetylglucosamine 2-epimerase n=1 Tax=Candidatus Fonsibacter ubiquis TaxID=1925548 RepID=UPI0028F3E7D2|nr:UDP-N-acetylglucosamine 2-epimerase (non-hydrolyzing) [Candidatus Fonsibacter ubiquis]
MSFFIMKTAFIFGTRPEIIKLSPIIKLFESKGIKFFIIHSGQHKDYNMNRIFINQLKIPKPKYYLLHKKNTSFIKKTVKSIKRILILEKPTFVIVQGDTDTVLAGAVACNILYQKENNKKKKYYNLVHVEAGLRSFDKKMPEEINRIITDNISQILLAPTKIAKKNIEEEKISLGKVLDVGNTIVDVVKKFRKKLDNNILNKFNLQKNKFIILTLHRRETVDQKKRLKLIINTIKNNINLKNFKIVFPIHPRTESKLEKKIFSKNFIILKPLDYFSFLSLLINCKLIITDSGGVQEEACILMKPCITTRLNTERPETIIIGANILTGYNSKKINSSINFFLKKKRYWKNPFGKEGVSKRIMNSLKKFYQSL